MSLRARLFISFLVAALSHNALAYEQAYDFKVWLGDRAIGEHTYRIFESADQTLVESRADYDVKFLFASLFKYRHEANEVWRNTCLVNLSSKTRMNGKRSSLEGQLTPGGFRLESKSAEGKETSTVIAATDVN